MEGDHASDFRLHRDGTSLYMEATILGDGRDRGWTARRARALTTIERVTSPDFSLLVSLDADSEQAPAMRDLRRRLEQWLSTLDWEHERIGIGAVARATVTSPACSRPKPSSCPTVTPAACPASPSLICVDDPTLPRPRKRQTAPASVRTKRFQERPLDEGRLDTVWAKPRQQGCRRARAPQVTAERGTA